MLVTVVWACVLPPLLLTPTAHAQAFRVQDLLAGGSSDLLRSSASAPSLCVTPDGEKGMCGSATTCPAYLSLLNNLKNETVLAFFRTRVCRQSPGLIHVCCPFQGSVSTPKPQSSSIFFFGPSDEPQPSRGGSMLPSQRPNARQPAGVGLLGSTLEEDGEKKDFMNAPVFPPQHSPSLAFSQFQTTPRPRPTVRTTQGPPTLPPMTTRTTTFSSLTGVFLSPDREPPVRGSLNPATFVSQDQSQAEPEVPSILPVEGECGSTTKGRTPWTVALGVLTRDQFRIICGGALISRLHVVAAAHCLQNPAPSHVRLGDPGSREHVVDVPLRSVLDPGYNPATRERDLALLTLATPVTLNDNIRPVCLPFPYRLDGFRGQMLQVFGYGITGSLEVGEVEVLGQRECRAAYQSPSLVSDNEVALFSRPSSPPSSSSSSSSSSFLINPRTSSSVVVDRRNICGSPAPSSSPTSCLSDHGAPLYFHDEETTGLYFLAGVSSLGNSCQTGPGLYTRVGAFIPWLSQQLSGVEALTSSPTFSSASTRTLQRINRNRG